jgi:hypothetical protein
MCYYVELLEAAVMLRHLRGVAKAGCCSRWGTSARSFEPLQHSFLHAFFHNLIYHPTTFAQYSPKPDVCVQLISSKEKNYRCSWGSEPILSFLPS